LLHTGRLFGIIPESRSRFPGFLIQDQIDDAIDVLDDACAPETTREVLAQAVGEALNILRGEDEDTEEEEDELDDEDDDLRD
jgi:hypothetical protein